MTNQPVPAKIAPNKESIPGELSLEDLRNVMGGTVALPSFNGGPKPPPPPPPPTVSGRFASPLKTRFGPA